MSDRKPPADLFDFPTGQGAGPPDRGDRRQGDLFGEQGGLGEQANSGETPSQRTIEGTTEDGRVPAPRDGTAHQNETWPVEDDHAYDPVGHDDGHSASGALAEHAVAEEQTPRVLTRWFSGAVDVALHVAVAAVGVGAMLRLGLAPSLDVWPGFAAFLLCFSFLYVTLPLAFWGQTPGMAWGGLQSFDLDGQSLTFVQAMLRWGAAVVTAILLGVPLLVAISGRSLADRLSGSETTALNSEALPLPPE